jgi:hypothetical protein
LKRRPIAGNYASVKYTAIARAAGISTAMAAFGMAACATSTTTTGYTPITGILIRSSALVAGFGCGTGPEQVYRYAATVQYETTVGDAGDAGDAAPQVETNGRHWTNIFDCFADGVFENLPSSSTGSVSFNVAIAAYDKASYDKTTLPSDLGCPPGLAAAAVCQSVPQTIPAADTAKAPWTTTCSATQQQGIPVLAVCLPLRESKTSAEAGAADGGASGGGALDAADIDDGGAVDGGVSDRGAFDSATGSDAGAGTNG